jgi:hypothetical protein
VVVLIVSGFALVIALVAALFVAPVSATVEALSAKGFDLHWSYDNKPGTPRVR